MSPKSYFLVSTFNVLYNYASALYKRNSNRCRVCLPLKTFSGPVFFPLILFKAREGDFVDEMRQTNWLCVILSVKRKQLLILTVLPDL